ncbi:hypothetical protein GQ44DRAFT_725776 [Phaeosphaeriaceae sp. PMI808]|nr:hypothetical protein GQ44DRAFT_725776 [Phaeosphaeriaceae sp. PMI808]
MHALKRPIRRVPLACVQCRSRKVKCDATLPRCNRCVADEKKCEYQKSRRGGRPRQPVATPLQIPADEGRQNTLRNGETLTQARSSSTCFSNKSGSGSASIGSSTHSLLDPLDSSLQLNYITLGGECLVRVQIDQLLSQYYCFFHTAHPCIVPRWSLQLHLGSEPGMTQILLPVLLYIGSIFTDTVDSAQLAITTQQVINSTRLNPDPLSPYYIQALLLYAIAVYASNEPERGRVLLDEVICSSLSLGMQRSEFASQHGQGDPVLEESWRRTWWMIYITDAHIAGSTHSFPTRTGAIQITTDLPCEEQQYESGEIPPPETLRSYNMREFSNVEFSSFAQLIGFTQGINQALATRQLGDIENAKTTANNADTAMTAWCSLLPVCKRKILRDDGSVDELLFKANILMHTYIVDTHRQLSSLKYFPIESVSKCVPPAPPSCNEAIKNEAHIHTAKILFSIDKLSTLLTLPTRFSEHTPFIICMVALITIAQLSACRYIYKEPKLAMEREKIRLNMGVLKMMGEVWPSGEREYHTMGIIAREILGLKDDEIHIPEISPVIPLDALDFNFDFDVDWGCSSFANVNAMEFMPNTIDNRII